MLIVETIAKIRLAYLRLQKRMKRTDAIKQRKAELAVASFVPPKAWGKG